jgi:hypothetical protein
LVSWLPILAPNIFGVQSRIEGTNHSLISYLVKATTAAIAYLAPGGLTLPQASDILHGVCDITEMTSYMVKVG